MLKQGGLRIPLTYSSLPYFFLNGKIFLGQIPLRACFKMRLGQIALQGVKIGSEFELFFQGRLFRANSLSTCNLYGCQRTLPIFLKILDFFGQIPFQPTFSLPKIFFHSKFFFSLLKKFFSPKNLSFEWGRRLFSLKCLLSSRFRRFQNKKKKMNIFG